MTITERGGPACDDKGTSPIERCAPGEHRREGRGGTGGSSQAGRPPLRWERERGGGRSPGWLVGGYDGLEHGGRDGPTYSRTGNLKRRRDDARRWRWRQRRTYIQQPYERIRRTRGSLKTRCGSGLVCSQHMRSFRSQAGGYRERWVGWNGEFEMGPPCGLASHGASDTGHLPQSLVFLLYFSIFLLLVLELLASNYA